MDNGLFHLNSVMNAYKKSTDNNVKKDISNWKKLKATHELIDSFLKSGIPHSKIIVQMCQQTPQFRHLDGWYAREELMLDFAGWLNVGFRCEIYQCFARQAEIDRLNVDIDHKQSTIDELKSDTIVHQERKIDQQAKPLEHIIDQNCDDLLDGINAIHSHVGKISPIATSLTNRVSTALDDEYLLLYADDDNDSATQIKIHVTKNRTMKKRCYKMEDAIAHVICRNAVDVQNELFKMIVDHRLNIGTIDRRTKTFVIKRSDMERLRKLIESDLSGRFNCEPKIIKNSTNTTAHTDEAIEAVESTLDRRVDHGQETIKESTNNIIHTDEAIEAAKLMLGDINIHPYFDKNGFMDDIINEAVANAKWIADIPFLKTTNILRSFRGDIHAHYPMTQRSTTPIEDLMNTIETIRIQLMHSPKNAGRKIYNHLNDDLTHIITESFIEYDIYHAYVIKRIIKSVFISNCGDNSTYTHNQKLLAFAYIVNHIPFVRLAKQRTKIRLSGRNVNVSDTLNRANEMINRNGIMDIIHNYLDPLH